MIERDIMTNFRSGREGLTILFAAGNDGPDSDTIGSPAKS